MLMVKNDDYDGCDMAWSPVIREHKKNTERRRRWWVNGGEVNGEGKIKCCWAVSLSPTIFRLLNNLYIIANSFFDFIFFTGKKKLKSYGLVCLFFYDLTDIKSSCSSHLKTVLFGNVSLEWFPSQTTRPLTTPL